MHHSPAHAAPLARPLAEAHPDGPAPCCGVLTRVALAWVAGVLLGLQCSWPGAWLTAAAVLALGMGVAWLGRRRRPGDLAAWLAIVALGAGWTAVGHQTAPDDHILRYVHPQRQLVQVTGQIDSPARVSRAPRGAMAKFGHRSLSTLYEMSVTHLTTDRGEVPVRGRLLVREPLRGDTHIQGRVVRLIGWLEAPAGPMNPGERDFRSWMADRDLAGFLTLPEADAWEALDALPSPAASGDGWVRTQAAAGHWASRSLSAGLEDHPVELALLEQLLLGRQGRQLEAVETAFRRVGLAHILSISGAHLGILVALVVMTLLWFQVGPVRVAWVVTAVLAVYLLAVPPQVPVMRSAVMAVMILAGQAMGRRVAKLDPLAGACVIMLIWRPHEILSPGFQLSFGVVAGLSLFTTPLAERLWPGPALLPVVRWPIRDRLMRWGMTYLSANVVAFVIAAPLVAYHFENFSPLTVPLSLLTLPWITAVLAMGYAKIALGLALPGLGADLATPLWWLTHGLTDLVAWAASWRLSFLELRHAPSAAWTAACLAVASLWLAGMYRRRVMALAASGVLLAVWLALLQGGYRTQPASWPATPPADVALRVNFFAVGDGNAYLLRFYEGRRLTHTWMYDCGSGFIDGGVNSILPALRELGVRRIDTLVISHADMDHFNAVPDVAWRIAVGRVLISPQMGQAVAQDPAAFAPAHVLAELGRLRVPVETIHRGWQTRLGGASGDLEAGASAGETSRGGAQVEALWPPADFTTPPENDNDLSLVLSIRLAGRRLLLVGDIQRLAIDALRAMEGDALRADVTDMPHHGSFGHGASLRWLQAVQPTVAVQSAGRRRMEQDPWADTFPQDIHRLVTATQGMVELDIHHDGRLSWRSWATAPGDVPSSLAVPPGR